MKTIVQISSGLSAACLLFALTTNLPAAAQTPTPSPTPVVAPTPLPPEGSRRILRGDRTVSNESFVLRSDETLQGDLTIFGGHLMLEENSRVEGNVSVFGGNGFIAGTVTGDVSIIGGEVTIAPSARIKGDLVRINSRIARAPGAVVSGRETTMDVPFMPRVERNDQTVRRWIVNDDRGPLGWLFGLIGSAVAALFGALLITIITLVIVALLPSNVAQAAATATQYWLISGAVGALTLLAVPAVAVILAITICLIPLALLLILVYGVAVLVGWAIAASIVGERIVRALNRVGWTPLGQALAGALLLALLGSTPIIGGLVGFAASALGLGALILTRAGTQPYVPQPATTSAVIPATPPAPPEPPEKREDAP